MKKLFVSIATAAILNGAAGPVFASGGSGGSGGGGSSTAVCSFINDYEVTSGYTPSSNSSLGAVWVQWKLNSCPSPSGRGIDIRIKIYDMTAGGVLLYNIPGMYAKQTVDFDNLKTGNAYHVDFTITDTGTNTVLVSRSTDISTPSHNQAGI